MPPFCYQHGAPKEEVTCCFPGIEPPAGSLSLSLILCIFHVKMHKGFIAFGGGGESRCYTSLLSSELAEEEGERGGGGDKWSADMA